MDANLNVKPLQLFTYQFLQIEVQECCSTW